MNNNSHNDHKNTVGSEAWSTAVTGTEEDRGEANGKGNNNAGDAAGAD